MLLTDMCLCKGKGNGLIRNICQNKLLERLYINKMCGGCINIRERIKIMKLTRSHYTQQQMKFESLSETLSTNYKIRQ